MDTGRFSGFEVSLEDPGIAWIQFNTPERMNGMTTAIKRDLIETVAQAQMDNRVRVVVFTGTGRAFCAGDDLKAYRDAELGGRPLVGPIPPGHDNAIGTYDGLRIVSQKLNAAIRDLDIPQALMASLGHMDCGVYAEVIAGGEVADGDAVVPREKKLPF